jgi:hypothetical protein
MKNYESCDGEPLTGSTTNAKGANCTHAGRRG